VGIQCQRYTSILIDVFSENLARALSDYLTAETGVTVVFESAIVPKWKDSRISFKNVFISRRPKLHAAKKAANRQQRSDHLAAYAYDVSNHPVSHGIPDEEQDDLASDVEDDENYAMFDLNVDSIDVTLSLWRWLDGKGLVQDAVIKGVRGVLGAHTV
jgi:mitochondrial distribution and morphology protein 31